MTLILTMLRCPDQVAPEERQVEGGEYSIGRGAENDWMLADPERFLSKRHCMLAFRSGGWQIEDVSTNGTFLNRESEPIGAAARDLNDGDRLRLGPYEIEVRVAAAQQTPYTSSGDPFRGEPSPAFGRDPLFGGRRDDPFGADPGQGGDPGQGMAPPSFTLPDDFNPLATGPDVPFTGPTPSDHSSELENRFRPPRTVLPVDWDRDLLTGDLQPPPAPMTPPPQPVPPQPVPPQSLTPEPLTPEPPTLPPEPVTRGAAPAPAHSRPPAPADDLLGAFLRGAGLEDATPGDPVAAMTALGAAMRAVVSGLRQALIARAAIKSEFRIEQTMIRRRGNNPLKFSADDDDALFAMLGAGRRTDMGAPEAIADAFRDIHLHELATMRAMQEAMHKLLAEFAPGKLHEAAEKGGLNFTAIQTKARAWDAFVAQHAHIVEALSDDFDSVFGRAFAQAYERAIADAAASEAA